MIQIEWQTVTTLIRLLLEDQSDLGLHCLPNLSVRKCMIIKVAFNIIMPTRERGGSVVELRSPEQEVRGSNPTSLVFWP